jgi:hypothetical protein
MSERECLIQWYMNYLEEIIHRLPADRGRREWIFWDTLERFACDLRALEIAQEPSNN